MTSNQTMMHDEKRLSKIFIYLIDIDILVNVNAAQNPVKLLKSNPLRSSMTTI